uniref:N-alpha-acetyltransferase 16 NatA auxiliary subunit-like n=1 Tax=Rhizophora mucronata TaxID=61149 RepID=A0A2P2MTJ7_RHIMU
MLKIFGRIISNLLAAFREFLHYSLISLLCTIILARLTYWSNSF